MLLLAQSTPITLTWEQASAILGIVVVLGGVAMAFVGLKYVSRGNFDAARHEFETRMGALETSVQVLAGGAIKQLTDGMSDVREELKRGNDSRHKLATVVQTLQTELALIRERPR